MTSTIDQLERPRTERTLQAGRVERGRTFGKYFSYYALAITIAWIASLKFTPSGSAALAAFAQHSPFLSWAYSKMDPDTVATYVGGIELLIAFLIALRPLSRIASALGAILAIGMFLGTLSFLFTTPGIATGLNFGIIPALSATGQSLLKDLVLLGVSIELFVDSTRRREVVT